MSRGEVSARGGKWGFKRHLFPMSLLSILLIAAVLASSVIGTTFPLFDDGLLRVDVRVDEILRKNVEKGVVFGTLFITNNWDFDILLKKLHTEVVSGTYDESTSAFDRDSHGVRLKMKMPDSKNPLLVPAHSSLEIEFSGKLSGDTSLLTTETDYQLGINVEWFELYETGKITRIKSKLTIVCIDSGMVLITLGAVGSESCQESSVKTTFHILDKDGTP